MKIFEFRLRFRWNLFLRVQLPTSQHWFRLWLGAGQVTSHCLNKCWLEKWRWSRLPNATRLYWGLNLLTSVFVYPGIRVSSCVWNVHIFTFTGTSPRTQWVKGILSAHDVDWNGFCSVDGKMCVRISFIWKLVLVPGAFFPVWAWRCRSRLYFVSISYHFLRIIFSLYAWIQMCLSDVHITI